MHRIGSQRLLILLFWFCHEKKVTHGVTHYYIELSLKSRLTSDSVVLIVLPQSQLLTGSIYINVLTPASKVRDFPKSDELGLV